MRKWVWVQWIYNKMLHSLRNHIVAFVVVVVFMFLGVPTGIFWGSIIWIFIQNQPAAFATLILALVTVLVTIKDPLSRSFNRPIIKASPLKLIKYPENKDNEISIFAVDAPSGSNPLHIWVRIYLQNEGKSVARDVYAKLVSVRRVSSKDKKSTKLKPFNPFKLRWTSQDRIIKYNVPCKGSVATADALETFSSGNLSGKESEYLNLCTLVGGYFLKPDDNKVCLNPTLVPGLPDGDRQGNIVGQGSVAGMNAEILKIKYIDSESKWEKACFDYEVIIGGSNFKTRDYIFSITCEINEKVEPSNKIREWDKYKSLDEQVNLSIGSRYI